MKAISFILGACLGGFIAVAVVLPATRTEPRYTRAGVERLEELRLTALQGDISQAALSLQEVVEYWPPKVSHDGQMARVLELSRAAVVREIISGMHALSGDDLGEDPTPWIEKYSQDAKQQANPQGGANGRQPFSSETNSTSAPAASRRSP